MTSLKEMVVDVPLVVDESLKVDDAIKRRIQNIVKCLEQ